MKILTAVRRRAYRLFTSWYLWNWGVLVPLTLVMIVLFVLQTGWFRSESDPSPDPPSDVNQWQSASPLPSSGVSEQEKILAQIQAVMHAVSEIPFTVVSERDELFQGIATDELTNSYLKVFAKNEAQHIVHYEEIYLLSGSEKITISGPNADIYACMDTRQMKTKNVLTNKIVSSYPAGGSFRFELTKNSETSRWEMSLFYAESTREKYCESYQVEPPRVL